MSVVSSESLEEEVLYWPKICLLSKDKHDYNVENEKKTLLVERGTEALWNVFNRLILSLLTDCAPHVVKDCAY